MIRDRIPSTTFLCVLRKVREVLPVLISLASVQKASC